MAEKRPDSKDTAKKGPWLVKSGDRVLGPYSTDDLAQLIREKEVVVIDEIMAPQSRWAYVRDVEAFASVVEEIRRGLMHSREDTEVQGYTSPVQKSPVTNPAKTPTESAPAAAPSNESAFNAASASDLDDSTVVTTPDLSPVTPKPTPLSAVQAPAQASQSSQQTAPAQQPPTPSPKPAAPQAKAPAPPKPVMDPLPHHTREGQRDFQAAPPAKKYVRPKIGGNSGVIIGSIVLIVAAGFIIYSVLKSPQIGHSVAGSDNLQTQASVAWKRGEFDRALELYRALNHDQPNDPIVAARLATLMMKLEGQTVEAKRIIESARANAKDGEQKSALAIASGLAALNNDDAKAAVNDFSHASSSWIASYNEGVSYLLMKEWAKAANSFSKAGDNAVALLMLARTHLSAGEAGAVPKPAARHEAEDAIKKALIQAPDYQQESLLLASYIDATAGNAKRAAKEVLEAVETDPNQTSDHFHDPSLSLDQVSWPKLLTYCQALHKELNSRISGAMLGLCLAKANQLEEAQRLVDSELGKDPGNTYLHATNAYLHILADRDDAARASLTLSTKNGTSRLAQILSARLCTREKQDACAEDGWSKLASDSNPPIAAITGLAQIRQQKGDTGAANALLVKADSMSPKYLPLLRLREDASR